jgi:hypothetical protein
MRAETSWRHHWQPFFWMLADAHVLTRKHASPKTRRVDNDQVASVAKLLSLVVSIIAVSVAGYGSSLASRCCKPNPTH